MMSLVIVLPWEKEYSQMKKISHPEKTPLQLRYEEDLAQWEQGFQQTEKTPLQLRYEEDLAQWERGFQSAKSPLQLWYEEELAQLDGNLSSLWENDEWEEEEWDKEWEDDQEYNISWLWEN